MVEAHAGRLPLTRGAFVAHMEDVTRTMWGDHNVPGESWLRDRLHEIKKVQDDLEASGLTSEGYGFTNQD